MHGVSDGFRNKGDAQCIQTDQTLSVADRGKSEQKIRNSATSRNQNFSAENRLTDTPDRDEEPSS